MRFIALDFETGGLNPKVNPPVSLGVTLVEEGTCVASKEWLLTKFDKKTYTDKAMEINGISFERMARDGLSAERVVKELFKWATKYDARRIPVVAFNMTFDRSFYSELLNLSRNWNQRRRLYEGPAQPLFGPWFCVREWALEYLDLHRYSLDSVCQHFGLSRTDSTHGAMEDAELAGKVFWGLYQLHKERYAKV